MKKRIILGIIVLIATFNTFSEELSSEELFNTGLKYHTEKNYKEAEKYYKESFLKKADGDTAYNLGVLYDTTKDVKQAEKYYKEAVRLGQVKAYYKLGYLYSKNKNKNLAIENYKQAVEKTKNVEFRADIRRNKPKK